jgi:adenylate kinase family enzyme
MRLRVLPIMRHPYGRRPMLESFQRTVIIGNCGSGKSVFAESLAGLRHIPLIDLDSLHWERDGHKRDEESAKRLVREAAATPRWIIEGVFGWLAEIALPRATAIIWLDLPLEHVPREFACPRSARRRRGRLR